MTYLLNQDSHSRLQQFVDLVLAAGSIPRCVRQLGSTSQMPSLLIRTPNVPDLRALSGASHHSRVGTAGATGTGAFQ